MSFPNKGNRQKCWDSRDNYWKCLDKNADNEDKCKEFRDLYEQSCPNQWVKHFDRKRSYLVFKERVEKDGFIPAKENS